MKMNIQAYTLNRNPNFLRLIEHLRQCFREREFSKEQQQQRRKIYSINHFIEHLRRCMHENPLLARVLFRFHHTIKNFSSLTNRKTNESFVSITIEIFSLRHKKISRRRSSSKVNHHRPVLKTIFRK